MAEPSLHHLLTSVTVSSKGKARCDDPAERDDTTDQDLTDRLIMSLVFDISQLADDIEQFKIGIYNLARQRGLVKEAEAA